MTRPLRGGRPRLRADGQSRRRDERQGAKFRTAEGDAALRRPRSLHPAQTGSLFITREKFDAAAKEVGLAEGQVQALWAKLAESSSQRIIAGATAPREDAANVNNWRARRVD